MKPENAVADFPPKVRLLMLLINLLPLLHLLVLAIILMADLALMPRTMLFILVLYVCPPLLARLAGKPQGRFSTASPTFLIWFATAQAQMLFNRVPILEEALRLIPGLYSAWLRLWGSRVGRLTFWAPGVRLLDRAYQTIGDDVVFGAGVRLNAHVIARSREGQAELMIAPIVVGSGAIIGGYSLLTAGVDIGPGEATRAFLILPPFSIWRNGSRYRASQGTGSETDNTSQEGATMRDSE